MTNASSGATPAISRFDLHSSGPMRLGSATGPVGFDQRAASIEVHFDVPIRLTPENVLAIVGPDLACEEPEMIDFAVSLDADLQPHPSDEDGPSVRRRQVSGRASTAEARAGDRRQRGALQRSGASASASAARTPPATRPI